mmetsp:Transcript_2487/g.6511  ORF Transcript_2487/g.6511 Transcript_2487/m.6511 type:complete len:258 (-) Transcript_2487:528-1301(-)
MAHWRCTPACVLALDMASTTGSNTPSAPHRAAPSGFFKSKAARQPTHCSCTDLYLATSISAQLESDALAPKTLTTCTSTASPPALTIRDLLLSDPASWRRHAAHALASLASPAAMASVDKSSSARATPPCSAVSLQMSSFTAVCLSAEAREAHRCASSLASTRLSDAHRADAAPALAKALECVNAPLAGSLGSSPVVNALTAAHAARRTSPFDSGVWNTATRGTSTPALMNAPLAASFLVAAAATTWHMDATDVGCD